MSITRQLFNEFRPLIRMLDEPFLGSPFMRRSLIDESFPRFSRPALDVTEKGNNYLIEADLPGVQKENVEVRISDGGRSVTIEGKIMVPSSAASQEPTSTDAQPSMPATQNNDQSVSERFVGNSTFTRTVWLPRPVETANVSAQLKDGVLMLSIPKAEDKATVTIPVQ